MTCLWRTTVSRFLSAVFLMLLCMPMSFALGTSTYLCASGNIGDGSKEWMGQAYSLNTIDAGACAAHCEAHKDKGCTGFDLWTKHKIDACRLTKKSTGFVLNTNPEERASHRVVCTKAAKHKYDNLTPLSEINTLRYGEVVIGAGGIDGIDYHPNPLPPAVGPSGLIPTTTLGSLNYRIQFQRVDLTPGYDREVVERMLRKRSETFQKCDMKELVSPPDDVDGSPPEAESIEPGEIVVQFKCTKKRLPLRTVVSNQTGNRLVERCISRTTFGSHFTARRDGVITVSFLITKKPMVNPQ